MPLPSLEHTRTKSQRKKVLYIDFNYTGILFKITHTHTHTRYFSSSKDMKTLPETAYIQRSAMLIMYMFEWTLIIDLKGPNEVYIAV